MQRTFCLTLTLTIAVSVMGLRTSCRSTGSCPYKISDQELRRRLTPLQYDVTQNMGTEPRNTDTLLNIKAKGIYSCVVCGNEMYSSEAKYDSKSGWPSFYDVIGFDRVQFVDDFSHGMNRTEVSCAKCGAHHGHVFNDGPLPTRLRYCINSVAMIFYPVP